MPPDLTPEELRHLRAFFLDETVEHLEAIDAALATLEAAPDDGAALAALLRNLHTLKGSAGTVEMDEVAREAHATEDRAVALRDAGRPVAPDDLAALVARVEALRGRLDDAARQLRAPLPDPGAARLGRREAPVDEPHSDTALQIRVEVDQVDELMEAVGELVLDRTRIDRRVVELEACLRALRTHGLPDDLQERLDRAAVGMAEDAERLRRTSSLLEQGLSRVRMMEVRRLFERLRAPAREMARRSGKEVELVTVGEGTAIDKAVVERVADPLLHLVRNAVAHGIEAGPARAAAGKPTVGRIELGARRRGAEVLLEVADDGAGVDVELVREALARRGAPDEVARLDDAAVMAAIFEPGISTRLFADDLAGRGVGLDAVRDAIARLGGVITCASTPGRGTRFTVRLPLTAATDRAWLFKVGGNVYAVPESSVVETGEVRAEEVRGERATLGDRSFPLVRLGVLLGEPAPPGPGTRRGLLLLEHEGVAFAATCDKLIGPRAIVVKGLGPLLGSLPLFAGATISGAGKVQLIIDVAALAGWAGRTASLGARAERAGDGALILVADDSRSQREMLSLFLAAGGYRAETVPDGGEAWELLQDRRFDALVTDVEMPRLDGIALTAEVRRHPDLRGLPVIVTTSHSVEATRPRALAAGADAFLEKPLRRQALLDALAALLTGAACRR